MAKEKEARRPFNLKKEVKLHARDTSSCCSGIILPLRFWAGYSGEFFHNSRNLPGKSPEV